MSRLGDMASATGTTIYAWALMPNHAHILAHSGHSGLPTFMRRLLTGYAVEYNHCHKRHGYLFQNRYKSIVCEEDIYFLELVRYIHLNPIRARLVKDLDQLHRYQWSGHSAIMQKTTYPWQNRDRVLALFGNDEQNAMQAMRADYNLNLLFSEKGTGAYASGVKVRFTNSSEHPPGNRG